jgi:tRNA A-37 threonylcarbamoyl transferase component Bud32/tetratricopeptide (TPR) repeat protein
MKCLDDNVVLAYVEHRLVEQSRPDVERHLDTCATCLALTCAVARSLDPVDERRVIAARYRLEEKIGEGATASVYAAVDLTLARRVALKLVHLRAGRVAERLSREARAMAQVKHPNVIAVYDAGAIDDETLFIAMELVDGETLRTWQQGKSRREVMGVYAQAGRGLAAAHRAGVVHRDFKPANVLIDREGRVAVTDFGLAFGDGVTREDLGVEATRGGAIVGTPRYMAPEQLEGAPADEKSDQFSLAASLYEGLHGAPPFPGSTPAQIHAAMAKPPKRTHRAITRALQRTPSDRYASVGDFIDALEAPRPRWWIGGVAIALLAVIAFLLLRRSPVPLELSAEHRLPVFVAPFEGNPTLGTIVGSELSRSPFVDVSAGPDLFGAALALGGTIDDVPGLVRRAEDYGKPVVLFTGRVRETDDGVEIVVDGDDPRIGGEVHVEETATRETLAATATRVGRRLRERLGETVSEPEHVALSTSLVAVERWEEGQRLAITGDWQPAIDKFVAALNADPDFAEARQSLGLTYGNLGRPADAATEMKRAIRGADRMGARQRLTMFGDYYGAIGKHAEAIAAYEQLLARWPGDQRTEINVTVTAIDAQSWPLAYDLAQRAVAHNPKHGVVHGNLLIAQVATNRFAEAVASGERMFAASKPVPFGLVALASAHALQGDLARARSVLAQVEDPGLSATAIADLETYAGNLDTAATTLRAYLAKQPESTPHAAQLADLELRLNHRSDAIALATRALSDGSVRVPYMAAGVLIRAGETAELPMLADRWTADALPEKRYLGHLLRGDLALARGQTSEAFAAYTLAEQHGSSWLLHARRAAAHEAAGDLEAAKRERVYCRDHRGELAVFMSPSLALVRETSRT